MDNLIDCLELREKEIVSLIGSGGKTSLMWYLASNYCQEKVLVSTTTKIGYPAHQLYDFFYTKDFDKLKTVGKGITLAGTIATNGSKLSALPQQSQEVFAYFDKVFLEADGSKQLPLKGWEVFEPVVVPETTTTIGVIPIAVLGKKITHKTIHRLPLFLQMTGASLNEEITEEILAEVISSTNGLFAKSQGTKILCINQVENVQQLEQAEKILTLLPSELLDKLTKVVACTIQSEEGSVLWQKQ